MCDPLLWHLIWEMKVCSEQHPSQPLAKNESRSYLEYPPFWSIRNSGHKKIAPLNQKTKNSKYFKPSELCMFLLKVSCFSFQITELFTCKKNQYKIIARNNISMRNIQERILLWVIQKADINWQESGDHIAANYLHYATVMVAHCQFRHVAHQIIQPIVKPG